MDNMKEVNLNELENASGGRNEGGYSYVPREKDGCVIYQIRRGDYLGKIAREFGVTVNAIMRANPELQNPDFIVTGCYIYIPV